MAEAPRHSLTFYTNPMSRGRIARWMLEEVGEPYETRYVSYGTEMKGADYRSVNPMAKVPALVHGGRTITEVAAICAYLADAFPDRKLAPPLAERSEYYRWLFFFAGPLEAALTNGSLGWTTDDPMERGRTGYGTKEEVLDAVEAKLESADYIATDRFTAADVYCGMQISWGLQFGTIDRRPAFEAYEKRMTQREAFKRAMSIDDAAVAEMQQGTV